MRSGAATNLVNSRSARLLCEILIKALTQKGGGAGGLCPISAKLFFACEGLKKINIEDMIAKLKILANKKDVLYQSLVKMYLARFYILKILYWQAPPAC